MELSSILLGIVGFVCMAPMAGMGILLGYRIGIKYDYMMYTNYYKRKGGRYPIEVERKYLRHTGIPLMINGLFLLMSPFMIGYSWGINVFLVGMLVTIVYSLIVPKYIAEKELKELNKE